MKLDDLDLSNKSKFVLARKFDLIPGELYIQLAILAKNGDVRFLGDTKRYNAGSCKVLSRGVPISWILFILWLLRK